MPVTLGISTVTKITGIYRNGVIVLISPVPTDWVDGREVLIPSEQVDLTGDSPESIAAWEEEFRQIHAMLVDDDSYEKLRDSLAKNKAEDIARWNASNAKLERIGS